MPLDPQAADYLRRQAEQGIPPPSELTPAEARRLMEEGTAVSWGELEPIARVRDEVVGGVPIRIYEAEPNKAAPILLWMHGGGWVCGSLETHEGLCRNLANRTGLRVVSIGYRLAPEHPFAAAVDDCWAVFRWTAQEARAVAVAGDSAGGNLAAVLALKARDAGTPLAAQLLIYPVMDHDLTTPSYERNAEGFGLTRDSMRWYWDYYLNGGDGGQPDASPLRAGSLAGVAPALVMACEYDVLYDEGLAYARRLQEAGVPVQVSDQRGMIHGFLRMHGILDRSETALTECAGFLGQHLNSPD
ncbi:MAG: alpha/beta hydrolase [Candidatus Dormibacteraeota bacterium]|uniref:Alpha/beta hydrolase n=1 Tax=Candidatus Dormiibacter inghamiae TaxID=3127013 RepID=A0A934NCM2_9BACT|nr:alpha/beta hydrolase [Candidatus Dormibacteraeota bacterium]MBJ7607342.1 alpha/beta hydrolase [Candidatus Dormibacteraeota bacterium]